MTPGQEREAHFDREVRANLRRNYLSHLAHGLFGQTGMRLINAPTFIPAYVFLLSGSEFAVGAARALQYLGMCLSPIVGATLIEHRRRVLPVGFVIGALMRVQILGLALAVGLEAPIASVLGSMIAGYNITDQTLVHAVVATLGIGLIAGVVPAWRASRIPCVTALSARE